MAFNNWDKFVEEYNKQNPGALPEDAASRMTALTPPEASAIDPSNYEVNISADTVKMNGDPRSLPRFSPSTSVSEQPKLNYTIEDDAIPAPAAPIETSKPSTPSSKVNDDAEAKAILSTGNDSARRDAELAALEKRKLPNKLASFGAGIGDAISASASPFGGNAPGGFQQRLMARQDKEMAADKANIDVKLRNDPNSDISKQYQNLVAQFLQKDPSDPTVLGLTANQIAGKIPQIEKLATLRQQKELQLSENASRQDARRDKQDAKDAALLDKKRGSIDSAKQQAGIIRGTIKDIQDRKLIGYDTAGPTGSSWIAPFDNPDLKEKLTTIASNIAIAALMKMRQDSPSGGAMGNVSDKDMATLMAIKGSLSQSQSPEQLKQNLARLDELYARIEGYDAEITPPWKGTPGDTQSPRQTKSGRTYTKGG